MSLQGEKVQQTKQKKNGISVIDMNKKEEKNEVFLLRSFIFIIFCVYLALEMIYHINVSHTQNIFKKKKEILKKHTQTHTQKYA